MPHIEAELIADQRQFVGKSHVDVARGVYDKLDRPGLRRIGVEQLPLQTHAVDRLGVLCASFGHAADDAVILASRPLP